MKHTPGIKILSASQIDKSKWDACVSNSNNALIYSYSWYLDAMAEGWLGVIAGDYEGIWAFPLKKKWGIKHIYMPPFIQRLSPIGTFNDSQLNEAWRKVKQLVSLIIFNTDSSGLQNVTIPKSAPNYILDLTQEYVTIADAYTNECKKNIRKAQQRGCVMTTVTIQDVIQLYKVAYGNVASYKEAHFDRLLKMMEQEKVNTFYHLLGVRSNETNELLYAGVILDDGKRCYYLLGAPNEAGRAARATSFFIDGVIDLFAAKRNVFDFEGSSIPSVASFYRSFNPTQETYFQYFINELPLPLRLIIDKRMKR